MHAKHDTLQARESICQPERRRADTAFLDYERALRETSRAVLACTCDARLSDEAIERFMKAFIDEDLAVEEYMQSLRALHEAIQRA